MPFDADDLAAFNAPDMPGYALATIGSENISGRFKKVYAEAFGMGGSRPVFAGASSDLAGVAVAAALTIDGVAYAVAEIDTNPPGQPGMTALKLELS